MDDMGFNRGDFSSICIVRLDELEAQIVPLPQVNEAYGRCSVVSNVYLHGNLRGPPPQCHSLQEIAGLIKGSLSIIIPVISSP